MFSLISLTSVSKPMSVSKFNKFINDFYGYVPSGLVKLQEDTFSVQSFIIGKTEVTNFDYKIFLNDLLSNGEIDKYNIAKVNSFNWSSSKSLNQKYVDYYHSHSAYRNHPVVNISKQGAELYCEWLTKRINANLPEGQKLQFRLPLKSEWLRAACGDDLDAPYSWKGQYVRNSKGMILANFVQVGEGSISRNEKNEFVVLPYQGELNDFGDIIAPTKSFWPNEFDIYNMNGNVAELLADSDEVIGGSWFDAGYDIRNRSLKKYSGSSPMVGFRVVATVIQSEHSWHKVKN